MKQILKIAGMAVLLASTGAHAQHADHGRHASTAPTAPKWTQHPVLQAAGPRSRTAAKFQAFNMHAMEAVTYAPYDGQGQEALKAATRPAPLDENGALAFKAWSKGGYYLLRVMGHGPQGEVATATTIKYFSNPGPAPRNLLAAGRPGFEIVPDPLPREHGHYRENETWTFHVRMDGKPMAKLPVVLETSNGTQAQFLTNDDGRVAVTFPGDFKDIPKDKWRHGRPPGSKFVLAVRNGGLLATYNGAYKLDAYGDKNLWAGIGFAMLGMIAAVPIVRRKKATKGG